MSTPGRSVSESRCATALALLASVLGLGLPFLHRAFHVDDAAYLAVAATIAEHPLHPFAGAAALDGRDLAVFAEQGRGPNTFAAMSHPPLVPYVIAAVTRLAGGVSEVPLHLAFLVFPLAALGSLLVLGRGYTDAPLLAALLLAGSPVFVLSAQGLMTDLPGLALGLAAFAVWDVACERQQRLATAGAGALLGLAALARYTALGLLALVALDAALRRKLRSLPRFVAGFAVVFGGWALQNLACCGEVHLLASARHYARYYGEALGSGGVVERAIADLAALGGTAMPIAPALVLAAPRGRGLWLALGCLGCAGLVTLASAAATAPLVDYSAAQRAGLVACLGTGLFLAASGIAVGVRAGERRRERLLLASWFLAGLLGAILTLPFGAARYLLPALAPLLLLLSNGAQTNRRLRAGLALGVPASFLLSLALAASDAAHAQVYRAFALALPQGQRVHFIGDWGFRFYMERRGARYLGPDDDSPVAGDLVVVPRLAANHSMTPGLRERVRLESSHTAQLTWPVRTLNREARAGFWSHAWGYLPFGLSRAPLETFDVYRVSAAADAP